ncbi:aldolase/citrate lyase family protein [Acuticoccus sp.]|uniref:aldolase/citrate lyase family protein n=1 Tax=Acuticoccus sp. TaxID=1904378 RepID=UPI003B51EDB0
MDMPRNAFKRALAEGRLQLGLWCSLPGSYAAEVVAGAGFDWLLFDTEHSPIDPVTVVSQLQAAAAYPVSAVVRPASNDAVTIKRLLDVGAQSLLVPFVESPEEAAAAVAAVRYPPSGVRGVAGITRATRFGRIPGYAKAAAEEICLVVQVESTAAIEAVEAIAAVDGVDGIFVGPSDLAASMGFAGEGTRAEVREATIDAIRRIRAAGKPAGALSLDPSFNEEMIAAGSVFAAVDMDAAILARGADAVAERFRRAARA